MTFSFLPAGKVESHPMFIISNYKFKVEKDWFLSSASYVKFPNSFIEKIKGNTKINECYR